MGIYPEFGEQLKGLKDIRTLPISPQLGLDQVVVDI